MRKFCLTGAILMVLTQFACAQAQRVELTLHRPEGVSVKTWPLSVGVPFAKGSVADLARLAVVDAAGAETAADITVTRRWPDGSIKWVRVTFQPDLSKTYAVAVHEQARPVDDTGRIAVTTDEKTIAVATGGATYEFSRDGGACFADVTLPSGKTVMSAADRAFYVVDSQGRRSTLKGNDVGVAYHGARHVVVRTAGDYLTEAGDRNAAGVIYYHFFAGYAGVHVSHKLIVTEETLDLWFKDIGVELPLTLSDNVAASFNRGHDDLAATAVVNLGAGQSATMVQDEFPHFGQTASHFAIRSETGAVIEEGPACGDWADASSSAGGVGVQLPGFAEQFPKAYVISPKALTIKLWASECGRELDFRTKTVVPEYFGNDWIPADSKEANYPNTARSTAKTHDFWIYPHAGALNDEIRSGFGATKDSIFASVDPWHMVTSGAVDPMHPYDAERFPRIEQVIRDFFVRNVTLPEKIFPNTGYIAWGRNPYTTAGWDLKEGHWYPMIHRLGRVLEYNLKRCAWTLYARSGDRLYYDWARRNTRFLGDFYSSNWDTGIKPLGWFVQGIHWHSPCFWGAFDEEMIREDKHPEFISDVSTLGYGTSEDVIQYVYDWYMAGDFHSRDSAQAYKDAVVKEINYDMDKLLTVTPTYVILRPVGSALEIDPDQKLYDFMHRYLEIVVGDGSDILNMKKAQNYLKSGEIWAGFYHYYTSTGDELALLPLLRGAERYYRTNRIELIYRGSGMPQAFSHAFDQTGDLAYFVHLRQAINDYVNKAVTLADRGVDPSKVTRDFDQKWGHDGAITTVSPVTIAIPVAMRAMAANAEVIAPRVPLAIKDDPTPKTYLYFKKEQAGAARIDLYLNNFGDLHVEPRLFDVAGKPAAMSIRTRESHRVDKPHGDWQWQWMYNQFYASWGTHLFFELQIDAPPGVYRLEYGDEVAMTVLYSDIHAFTQVAPDGMQLQANHDYYFTVPEGVDAVDFFAHRPVKVFDPSNNEVEQESPGLAVFRFKTAGHAGIWRMASYTDKQAWDYPFLMVNSYVKFLNMPTVMAMDSKEGVFDVPVASHRPAVVADLSKAGEEAGFTPGRFGEGALLGRDKVVEVDAPASGLPREKGTIEFWFRPHWSTTDLHLAEGKYGILDQQMLRADPIMIMHHAGPQDAARGAGYLKSYMTIVLMKKEGEVHYPAIMFLQAGRWYHIAVTWHVDGENTDIEVFINGRRKTYGTYREGVPHDLKPEELAEAGKTVQFGSAIRYTYRAFPGQTFDELRVSKAIRYTDDFEPPTGPFQADGDTVMLMHLDGSLAVDGSAVVGKAIKAAKLK